jgi:hypothetical protein
MVAMPQQIGSHAMAHHPRADQCDMHACLIPLPPLSRL